MRNGNQSGIGIGGPGPAAVLRRGALALVLAAAFSSSARASFHLMVIQEVFAGPPGDIVAPQANPDTRGQYVMLRMTSANQGIVSGARVRVEDASGNVLGSFGVFQANVTGGAIGCTYGNPIATCPVATTVCPAILMGTQGARDLFTIAFDQIVNGQAGRVALPLAGGRVCFLSNNSLTDCLAWGSFNCTAPGCSSVNGARTSDLNANGCDTTYGTPAPALQYGQTLRRTAFSCATKNNATDFVLSAPRPVNSARNCDNTDADTDGLIDVLDCNDASTSFLWRPHEVTGEGVSGTPVSTIQWDSQAATAGAGVTYDVVRGSLAGLPGFSDASCLSANGAAASAMDGAPIAPGGGFYYLTRAGGGTPGCTGTYGSARDSALSAVCP